MHQIRIDRRKSLAEEPHLGHNRYHPDIQPIMEVGEGEEVMIETRDSVDGQLPPTSTVADFGKLNVGAVHPLTGPIAIKGAEPGDGLEVEFLEIEPQPWGWSGVIPGLGFLRDIMNVPFLVHWKIQDGWATSEQIPQVRIPGAPFMGVSGVAPSPKIFKEWTEREQRLLDRGVRFFHRIPTVLFPAASVASADSARTRRERMAETST